MLKSFSSIVMLAAVTAAGPLPSAEAQTRATGVVYHDADGNGRRDAGEPGLAGVRVSNGEQVVLTDRAGRYELPVSDNTILFVVKPRDWMTPVDERNLPRFYHVHRPEGAPDDAFIFKGVEPTGPLPESVDFPLYERQEDETFEVVLVGDPQPYDTQEVTWYARAIAPELAKLNAVFAIALGDLVGDNLNLLGPYNEVNATVGYPFYNVIGNHDQNYLAPTDEDADATFERVYGPPTYAFQHGRAHFIILDNVFWKGFNGYRKDGWPKRGGYEGRIREDQLAFIDNYVRTVPKDELIIVCSHIPMVSQMGETKMSTPEFPRLLEILSSHPHTVSFSGHTHVNFNVIAGSDMGYRPSEGTIHLHHNVGTASGSWYRGPLNDDNIPSGMMRDGTPRGYAVLSVRGNAYSVRFQPFGRPADHQMRIVAPDVVERGKLVEVHANVFNGSERSTTRMRVGPKGEWIPLRQLQSVDPHYVALGERYQAEIGEEAKGMPKPVQTNHHWVAPLPTDLPEGVHLIEVETTDLFGQTFRGTRPIRVVSRLEAWDAYDIHNIRVPRERPAASAK